jgi:HD-GYP domain-containing protein (c-di-GMP phosphodiesterase class II)
LAFSRSSAFAFLVAGLLVVITILVQVFENMVPSYVHLYYIPILIAGFFLGYSGGVVTGLASALLSGYVTFMHQFDDTAHGMMNLSLEITIRSIFFFSIGVLTAWLSSLLGQRGEEAAALFSASHAISQSLRLDKILPSIARMATEITQSMACSIRLLSPEGEELLSVASFGLSQEYLSKGPVKVPDSPVDDAVMQGEMVTINDVAKDTRFRYREAAKNEGLVSCISVPLKRGEKFLGVLRVYSDEPRIWNSRDKRLLKALSQEASVAIENAELHESLRRSYWETVRAMTRSIEAKDPAILGHSERVTELALQIGHKLGLPQDDLESLRFAATLHDIGKIAVEEQLMRVTNPQSYRQALELNHPLVGMSILQPAEFLRPALSGVRYHHERYDGTGYPEGLRGKEIPLIARIVAVANSYDNLINPYSGTPALSAQTAREEIEHQSGRAFDPEVVEAFLSALHSGEREAVNVPA